MHRRLTSPFDDKGTLLLESDYDEHHTIMSKIYPKSILSKTHGSHTKGVLEPGAQTRKCRTNLPWHLT